LMNFTNSANASAARMASTSIASQPPSSVMSGRPGCSPKRPRRQGDERFEGHVGSDELPNTNWSRRRDEALRAAAQLLTLGGRDV
jgi:hypothetical protein